ncbi:hypothetical protein ES703_28799 [subsurface metagenome]
MKKAYLLIDVDTRAKAYRVADALRHKPCISFADAVTGPHDVIAVLEGWDKEGQGLKTLTEVREIAGVRYVTACFAIRTDFGNEP